MDVRTLKPRAVIFDVYKTLLEVGPAPADRELRWRELWMETLGLAPRLTLEAFTTACTMRIAEEHAHARQHGIAFPEIFWPDILRAVVPELNAVTAAVQAEFSFRHIGLTHTLRLSPGVAEVLIALRRRGVLLGIASNAQPYTPRELEGLLRPAGLALTDFAPDLIFWSFAHGFSKPDPHVFRLLGARLRDRGVALADALLVGDRLDNDIVPARAQGWPTWHLHGERAAGAAGSWTDLAGELA